MEATKLVLRDVFNDTYKVASDNDDTDVLLLNSETLSKLYLYGIKVDGIKHKLDGTILSTTPRSNNASVIDEEKKIKKLESFGYQNKGKPLADFMHDVLVTIALECDFTGEKIDRTFIGIVRKMYPTLPQILTIGYHRTDGGYDKNNKLLYGITYKNKDAFYKYPEFSKVVNNMALLILLGSFKEYYKYADCRHFHLGFLEKDHITVPYLDNCNIKIEEDEVPYDSFQQVWMDSDGVVTFDLLNAPLDTISQIIFDTNKSRRLPSRVKLLVPRKYENIMQKKIAVIDGYNSKLDRWSNDRRYYFGGVIYYV